MPSHSLQSLFCQHLQKYLQTITPHWFIHLVCSLCSQQDTFHVLHSGYLYRFSSCSVEIEVIPLLSSMWWLAYCLKSESIWYNVQYMRRMRIFLTFNCSQITNDPFYPQLKILVVLWLLSPATRGSSILYRKFVHPWLTRREDDIDNCIAQAKQQGYSTVIQLGTKGVNYATTVLMQTAIKASQRPQASEI